MAEKRVIVLAILAFISLSLSTTSSSAITSRKSESLSVINKLNLRGPSLGLITVFSLEEDAFFATGAFKPDPFIPYVDLSGRRFRVGTVCGKQVIYVRCGIGMVNAAAATQQILDLFDIEGIIHFGISGNANDTMFIGDVVIPKQFANTGLWDWLNPDKNVPYNDVAQLDIGNYNAPKGDGNNSLGLIGYSHEEFYSASGTNTPEDLFWFQIGKKWLQLASSLEASSPIIQLPGKPKLVVGLNGATANTFLDNAAYRDFLFLTFQVTSVDMESSAVVMTTSSNGYPVIVIRGLSDLAGGQVGENQYAKYGPLAAHNVAKAVIKFIKIESDISASQSSENKNRKLII